jgi:ASC-1-like (ASCH) protein
MLIFQPSNMALGATVPTFLAKKEVFEWLVQGKKTIDVRKGSPQQGETAVFLCGPRRLTLRVVKTESGQLSDVIREDNYRQIIPDAANLSDAFAYLRGIYGDYAGVFTAYTVTP